MINKNDYLKLKRYLKLKSKPEITDLLNCVGANDEEKKLFLLWYDGNTRVKSSMDSYVCCDTFTKYLKKIFSKICNYFNYQNISF